MIYFIQSGQYVKVGYTSNLKNRYRKYVTENPEPIKLIGTCKGGLETEKKIHNQLHEYHYRGEWFHLTDAVKWRIREIIRENKDNVEKDKPAKTREKTGHNKVYGELRFHATPSGMIDITNYTKIEIADKLGVKTETITKHVNTLIELRQLSRIGSIYYLN